MKPIHRMDPLDRRNQPPWILILMMAAVLGCEMDTKVDLGPPADSQPRYLGSILGSAPLIQDGSEPPTGLVPIAVDGHTIQAWPYTGESFNGVPSDPINLVFVGPADPAQFRAALRALE